MDATVTDHEAATTSLRIGHVSLAVRDLAGMEAFYRRALGLRPTSRSGDRVLLGAGREPLLELLHRPGARPDLPGSAGLFHTAFLLPAREDLGRWLAHAAALRLRLDGASDHLVSEAVYLDDPEGNGIEVYADRPRATWAWRDGRVQMASLPLDRAGLVAAGGQATWQAAPDGTRIGHVHLRVGELATAVRFYGEVVGLDLVAGWDRAAFLSSGGYHHHVGLNTWRSLGAGPRDPSAAGLAAVTLVVGSSALAGLSARSGVADPVADGLRDPWNTLLRVQRT